MTRITLICAAGMSTSLQVSKMNIAAVKSEADVKIRASADVISILIQ